MTEFALSAAEWDAFLGSNERGQFQQASGWGRTKALDGWNSERIGLRDEEGIAAGVQLLWKRTRLGCIGYVSKGPVLRDENQPAIAAALDALQRKARELHLLAMIVQPPDRSRIPSDLMVSRGFSRSPVESVIRSTAIIDVTGGIEACRKGMSRQARREMRRAAEQGVTIRTGDRSDLPSFFDMMCYSSARQGSRPNPSRAELLRALWDAFPERLNLWLAMRGKELVAGLLGIAFNDRLTLWKKGWSPGHQALFANTLLNGTAIEWAASTGLREVDFVGMSLDNAETLLGGQSLSEKQRRTRDFFNLRLGAQPALLPPARLYITASALRWGYRTLARVNWLDRLIMQRLARA